MYFIYILVPFSVNYIKIGKSCRSCQDIILDYTRTCNSSDNICLLYFPVAQYHMDFIYNNIQEQLKKFNKISDIYNPQHYTLYLNKITEICSYYEKKPVKYIQYEHKNNDYMVWTPTN